MNQEKQANSIQTNKYKQNNVPDMLPLGYSGRHTRQPSRHLAARLRRRQCRGAGAPRPAPSAGHVTRLAAGFEPGRGAPRRPDRAACTAQNSLRKRPIYVTAATTSIRFAAGGHEFHGVMGSVRVLIFFRPYLIKMGLNDSKFGDIHQTRELFPKNPWRRLPCNLPHKELHTPLYRRGVNFGSEFCQLNYDFSDRDCTGSAQQALLGAGSDLANQYIQNSARA